MNQFEYGWVQVELSNLLTNLPSNREDEFNKAILACKSMLSYLYNNKIELTRRNVEPLLDNKIKRKNIGRYGEDYNAGIKKAKDAIFKFIT